MSNNKELGEEGELLAAEYLKNKGYSIREMNYRFSHAEIDIIAQNEKLLVFVEVKMRSGIAFGMPEDFVDDKKAEMISLAAGHYLESIDWPHDIRFDIISILKKNKTEILHIEDAFY